MTEKELKSRKVGFLAENKKTTKYVINNVTTIQKNSPVGNSSELQRTKAATIKAKMQNELLLEKKVPVNDVNGAKVSKSATESATETQKEKASAVKGKILQDVYLSQKEWKEPTTAVNTIALKELSEEEIETVDKYQFKVYKIRFIQKMQIKRAQQIKFAKQNLSRFGNYSLSVAKKAIKSNDTKDAIAAPVTVLSENIANKLMDNSKLGQIIGKPISKTAAISKSMIDSESTGGGLVEGVGSLVVNDIKNVAAEKIKGYGDWLNKKSYERNIRRSNIKADKKIQKAMNSYGENAQKIYRIKEFSKTQVKTYKGNVFLKYNNGNVAKKSMPKIAVLKKIGSLIFAGGGVMIVPVIIMVIILFLLLSIIKYPFTYFSNMVTKTDDDGNSYDEIELTQGMPQDVIAHYHEIMNDVVKETNKEISGMFSPANIQNIQDGYNYTTDTDGYNQAMNDYNQAINDWMDGYILDFPDMPDINNYRTENPPENCPIFEGYFWSDDTDGTSVPYKKLYNEMLAVIATNNLKQITNSADGEVIYMDDETVQMLYNSLPFWVLSTETETSNCGSCRTRMIEVSVSDEHGTHMEKRTEAYCPGHIKIIVTLSFDYDISKVQNMLNFDENDIKGYEEVLKQLNKDLK